MTIRPETYATILIEGSPARLLEPSWMVELKKVTMQRMMLHFLFSGLILFNRFFDVSHHHLINLPFVPADYRNV